MIFKINVMNNIHIQQKQVENAIQNAKLESGISPLGAVLDNLLPDAYIKVVRSSITSVHLQATPSIQSLETSIDNIRDIVNILIDLEKQGEIRITNMDTLRDEKEYIGQLPQKIVTTSAELPKEISDWLIEHSSCKIELLNLE